MEPLTIETANKIYDILVNYGGAREEERDSFIDNHVLFDKDVCDEWRFQGKFGFGGKYWRKRNSITCYTEDLLPETDRLLQKINEELKKLNHEI